jgi:purine-cytosine permease-like protein
MINVHTCCGVINCGVPITCPSIVIPKSPLNPALIARVAFGSFVSCIANALKSRYLFSFFGVMRCSAASLQSLSIYAA